MIHRADIEKNVNRFLDHRPDATVTGHVIWQAIQFTATEKAMALPTSFTRGSSMNLVTPKLVDTSDRSLVETFGETFGEAFGEASQDTGLQDRAYRLRRVYQSESD